MWNERTRTKPFWIRVESDRKVGGEAKKALFD
jgi:hypothetical protein